MRRDYGDLNIATLKRKHVVRMLEAKTATPSMARAFLCCLRLLIRYAIDIGVREDDPTVGVRVDMPESEGFPHLDRGADCRVPRNAFAVGTKPRLALELLLGTALRCADVVKLGRGHVRSGGAAASDPTERPRHRSGENPDHYRTRRGHQLRSTERARHVPAQQAREQAFTAKQFGQWFTKQGKRANRPQGCLRRMACARRLVSELAEMGWMSEPRRSPPSAAIAVSRKCSVTSRRPIERNSRATPWPRSEWQHRSV